MPPIASTGDRKTGVLRWLMEERPLWMSRWFWILLWFSVAVNAIKAIHYFVEVLS